MIDSATREKALRSALFVHCKSMEELHRWIKIYLGLDLPNVIVCDDDVRNPPSNSSPMHLCWEIYSKALQGDDKYFQEVLAYSSREGFKSLGASVIEVLALIHLDRNVVHAAAIEAQAKDVATYIGRFLSRPILREFITSRNKRLIEFTRYEKDDQVISPVQLQAIPQNERLNWVERSRRMEITTCTMDGMNGKHAAFVVQDETDLSDPAALMEGKSIPVMTEDGKLSITLYTSTRKFSFGPVQKLIDNAGDTHIQIRHWNMIDVTEACPPSRHLPDEPKIDIFHSDISLKAVPEEDYNKLSVKEKESYVKTEGYSGCLKNCKLFSSCLGRLATKQTSKSKVLKKIDHTEGSIRKVSVEHAKAQYLTWKPSSAGLVYPFFNKDIHGIPAYKMAELMTGEEFPEAFSKEDLIQLVKDVDGTFLAGVDWGFTHEFSVVTAALVGHVLYVIDVIAATELEDHEKVQLTKAALGDIKPLKMYPDNAYPSTIKTFRKAGFTMVDFKKDVLDGIDSVRSRLTNARGGKPFIYFLSTDEKVQLLMKDMGSYHWKLNKDGTMSDEPDDKDDDKLDALRYLAQNCKMSKTQNVVNVTKAIQDPNANWMTDKIRSLVQDESDTKIIGQEGGIKVLF